MHPIETDRLIIRRFRKTDWKRLREIGMAYEASELAIYDRGPWPEEPEVYKEIVEKWSESDNCLAVELKDRRKLVGFISLVKEEDGGYEIGYNFHPDARGIGLATQSCEAVLTYMFDKLDVEHVSAGTAQANVRSRKLLDRLGFRFVKEETVSFRKDDDGNPITFTGLDFVLSKEDWHRR